MRHFLRRLAWTCLAAVLIAGCGGEDKKSAEPEKPAGAAELVDAGLSLLEQGQQDAALAAFQEAAAKEPGNHFAHYNVGVILQQRGDAQGALSAYGRALTAKPDYVPALFNEAILLTASNPALAVETYRRIVKLQPKAPTAYLNLGLLEAKLNQLPAARRDLAKAIEQDPSLLKNVPPDVARKVGLASPKASPVPSPS